MGLTKESAEKKKSACAKPRILGGESKAEIDAIFGNKKRKSVSRNGEDVEQLSHAKNESIKSASPKRKKKERAKELKERKTVESAAPAAKSRKKTADGLTVYTEDEIKWNLKNAGGTPLCPFDCECCF